MIEPDAPLVHPDHGSNLLFRGTFTWGPVADDFAAAEHTVSYRARWGRSSTVPIETFGVAAQWDPATGILDVWASIQMPNYQEQIGTALGLAHNCVRVHNDVDVGGSYGVKRGIKHTVLVGYLARKLGMPVRFIEDRLDNMSGGDAHGPDRIFDTVVPVSSTQSAEMVKLLENTFRAINIGLANEVALMCERLGLDVWEVIEAAATKPYGFMKFLPGPDRKSTRLNSSH